MKTYKSIFTLGMMVALCLFIISGEIINSAVIALLFTSFLVFIKYTIDD